MAWFIEEVLELLASEAGNLAYHLVLVFSIAGALQIAFSLNGRAGSSTRKRSLAGLGLLLAFQIILFIAAALVWRGQIEAQFWLPLLDRIAALLSLVVIVWLWAYPEPDPQADAAALGFGLVALVGSIAGAVRWQKLFIPAGLTGLEFNGSPIDLWMQVAALVVIALGVLSLFLIRPGSRGYALAMLLLLGSGHLAHLLSRSNGGDYPTVLRLFEIAAYPFLLLIPLQVSSKFVSTAQHAGSQDGTSRAADHRSKRAKTSESIDLQILQSLLLVSDEQDEDQAYRQIVTALAAAAGADRAFLVSPPDEHDQLKVLCDFDRVSNRFLESTPLAADELPILTSCLKQGRVRRLAAASTAPDRLALSRTYGLEQTGEMLFVPFLSKDGDPLNGAILVGREDLVEWDAEKQSTIGLLARLLVDFLQRSHDHQSVQSELNQARQSIRRIQEQVQLTQDERQQLRDRIAVLQENLSRDQEQIALLSTVTLDRDALETKIADLEEEKRSLEELAGEARKQAVGRTHPLEEELRLTLSELALLRLSIEENEMRAIETEARQAVSEPGSVQLDGILAIAQDLRQPVTSITGNVDALQSETNQLLSREQQKYLERIRLSAARLLGLIDELGRAASAVSNPENLSREKIELSSVIQEAIENENNLIRLRRLWLQTELPGQPLVITTDRDALRSIIDGLLHNAGTATPEEGQIGIAARLESSKTERDYVLVQVLDHGGGISESDLPLVFASPPPVERINGLGDGSVDIGRLKTLVETLEGRLWVDSEPGIGSTFSLLLPVDVEGTPAEAA